MGIRTGRTALAGRWHRPIAATTAAFVAMTGLVVGSAAIPLTATAAEPDILVGGFETGDEGWGLSAWGDDLETSDFTRVEEPTAPQGTHVAQVDLTVGSDGDGDQNEAWAELFRDVSGIEMEELGFQVKAPGLSHVVVRVYDAFGETFSIGYALDPGEDWQLLTVTNPPTGYAWSGSWGGSDGNEAGVIDNPITRVGFVVEAGLRTDGENPAVTVQIDDVRLAEPPPLPPATPDGYLVGGFQDDANNWSTWGWTTDDGTVSYGFEAVEDATAPEGTHVAEVSLDSSAAPDPRVGFVEFFRHLPGLDVDGFSFAIKAPGLQGVNLRLYDRYEELFQIFIPLEDSEEWQEVAVPAPNPDDYVSWGGSAANTPGVWEGPANRVGIVLATELSRDPQATAVSALIDDVRVEVPPAGLRFGQVELGNVFVGTTPAEVTYETAGDALTWTLRDAAGAVVASGGENDVEAGGTLSFDIDRGWYSLTARAFEDGAVLATASTTLARIAEHTSSDGSPFGVATHYGASWSTDSVPLVTAAGLATVRDEIYWSSLETEQGVYDWSVAEWTEPVIDAGLDLLLIPGYGNPLYGGDAPTTPEAIAAYAAYAAAMAERFQDSSAGIEIWNEWEIAIGGTTVVSPESYVELLEVAAPAVNEAAPGLPVIGPATVFLTTEWEDTGVTWLERTFQLGALEHIDGVVLHAYTYPRPAEELDASLTMVDALIRQYNGGETKPMWVTEHGWPTGTDARGISEAAQANNLTKAAAIGVKHDLEQYIWYDFQNDGIDVAYTEHNFGLIHHPADALGSYTPKPGYVAYATATSMLDAATFVEQGDLPGVWDLAYDTDTTDAVSEPDLRVLWATQDTTVGIQSAVPFTVTTQYGVATEYAATGGGSVVLQLTNEPVYVSGVIDTIVQDGSRLTIDEAFVGQPLSLQWTADNTAGDTAQTFALAIDGLDEPATQAVPAGETGTTDITLPTPTAVGTVRVVGELSVGGQSRGVLTAVTDVQEALALTGWHTVDADGDQGLRLRLINRSAGDFSVTGLDWSVAAASGSALAGQTLTAGETLVVDVPVADVTTETSWTAVARVVGHDDLVTTGALLPVGDLTDAAHRSITVDGELDDLSGLPSVTIVDGAAGDLEATVWYTWDDEALYLSASIVDDVHHQAWTGADVWQGDSLQVALTGGGPGEALGNHQEIGLALTPEGPQVHRWLPNDQTGPVPGVEVAISRDDDATVTVYEAAFPWSSIGGWDTADGLFASAIVINDNDGAGRSWVEWGSGIATGKDPSLFNAMRAVPAPPVTEPVPGERPVVRVTSPRAGQTVAGTVTVTGTATDDHGLLDDTVTLHLRPVNANGNCGGFMHTWTAPVVDGRWSTSVDTAVVAPGRYCITVLTKDDAGQQNAGGGTHVKAITVVDRFPRLVNLNARAQCVNGRAHVAVYAVNGEQVPVDVRLTTPYGDRKVDRLAPRAAAYALLDSGQDAVGDGVATVAGYLWDGTGHHELYRVPYAGVQCG